MAIEDGVGKSFPQRGHDQRPNRDIRHKVTVHHIAMEHRAAAVQRRFRLLAKPREVCGKNRGCQFEGHGQRATPSFPRRKQMIRGSSSMLAEKCDSKENPLITTESYGVSGCLLVRVQVAASHPAPAPA